MTEQTMQPNGKSSVPTSIALFVCLFGASLFSYTVGGTPVSISDLALVVMVLWSLVTTKRVAMAPVTIVAGLWLIVALAGGLAYPFSYLPLDRFQSFASAFVYGMFGVSLLLLAPPLLRRVGAVSLGRALLLVIRIHAIVLLIQALAHVATGNPDVALRVHGLFREPAWFGWFVALSLFALAAISKARETRFLRWWDYLLFLASSVLSLSLVAAAFVPLALVAVHWTARTFGKGRRARFREVRRLAIAIIMLLGLAGAVFWLLPEIGPVHYLRTRIVRVLTGKDASVMDRIVGTLEVFDDVMKQTPLRGTAIGNGVVTTAVIAPNLTYKETDNNHIAFINVFITTGVLGGLLYLVIIAFFVTCPSTRVLGVGFFLIQFGYGGYRLAVLWFFVSIGIALAAESRAGLQLRNAGGTRAEKHLSSLQKQQDLTST